jgi:hypothetical protein
MSDTDSQLSSGKAFRERLANIRHDLNYHREKHFVKD